MWLGQVWGSNVSGGRMAPRLSLSAFWMSQNASLVKSKKRHFKWWKTPKNSFPAFLFPQIATCLKSIKRWFHGFNTLCYRLVCLLADPKMRLGEIEKAMFQVVEWHWELNIWVQVVPKYDLNEVEKVMFLGVESPCKNFSDFWSSKMRLGRGEEEMLQVFKWPWGPILDVANCDFDEVDKGIFQIVKISMNSFPAFWPPKITTKFKLIKRCFFVSTQPATGLSASWETQNAISAGSRKTCYKWSNGNENSISTSGCP
jgi:hypothetical protein